MRVVFLAGLLLVISVLPVFGDMWAGDFLVSGNVPLVGTETGYGVEFIEYRPEQITGDLGWNQPIVRVSRDKIPLEVKLLLLVGLSLALLMGGVYTKKKDKVHGHNRIRDLVDKWDWGK